MVEITGVVVCTSKVVKELLPFCKEFGILCIEITLLLTVLPKFEREAAFKDSAFSWVACLTRKIL